MTIKKYNRMHQYWCESVSNVRRGQKCNCICERCGAQKETFLDHTDSECINHLHKIAATLHQELANALVLIRLRYGNLDPEVWAWQQRVSELLKGLKVE